jgi:hypothetical protein
MPTLSKSRKPLDPSRYRRIDQPRGNPIETHVPFAPHLPPEPPVVIRRSPVMISSLPSIATNVDGIARQFYGGPNVPTRRLVLPG